MAPSHRRKALALALAIAALWLPAGPVDAQTTPSSPQPASPDPNALKLRFGIEYLGAGQQHRQLRLRRQPGRQHQLRLASHQAVLRPAEALVRADPAGSGRAFPQCAGAESQRHVHLRHAHQPAVHPDRAPGPAGGLRSARGGDPSTTVSARKSARCGGEPRRIRPARV